MGLISELRYPTQWYSKLIVAVLAIALFGILAAATISGYLLYQIVVPVQSHSEISLRDFPGHPEELPFTPPGRNARTGWFFPGLKSAPTVVLCPAYLSSAGDLLTLASSLQDHQYNVFVFDFSSQGTSRGYTTLGYQEVGELRAAMDAVAERGDVDAERFGLWGIDLGGYVALAEASADPRVRALAVESVYEDPQQMAQLLVDGSSLNSLPWIGRITIWGFRLLNYRYRKERPLSSRLGNLSGVTQLYLETAENPGLAQTTGEIFSLSPPPHDLVTVPRGDYSGMSDDEKREYENRILSFFLAHLPPVREPSRRR
jgi:hypothetical protein